MTKKPARTGTKLRAIGGSAKAARALPAPRALPALPKDVAIVSGPTEDGQGARVLRFKEGEVFAGEVRPMREGQPIDHHEIVRLRPLHERSPVCEVEVLHAGPARDSHGGPARVATDRYRRNWSAVFGSPGNKAKKPDFSVN